MRDGDIYAKVSELDGLKREREMQEQIATLQRELAEARQELAQKTAALESIANSLEYGRGDLDDAAVIAIAALTPAEKVESEPASVEALPLMARRERDECMVRCAVKPDGSWINLRENEVVRGIGYTYYRIADTDEHGLPVVPRTKEMPEGAKYRAVDEAGKATCYADGLPKPWTNDGWGKWQRIEDYNGRGQ